MLVLNPSHFFPSLFLSLSIFLPFYLFFSLPLIDISLLMASVNYKLKSPTFISPTIICLQRIILLKKKQTLFPLFGFYFHIKINMFKIDPYTTSTPNGIKKKASINKHTINQTNKPDEFYLFLVSFKQHWIFLNPYLHLITKYFCVSFMFLPMHYFLFHPTLTYLIQICWNMVHIFFKCSLWLLCTHMKYHFDHVSLNKKLIDTYCLWKKISKFSIYHSKALLIWL